MSEHKEPIPSMIYNAAVGGHVTDSQQIIDENLNKEQIQINQETDTFIKSKGNANGIAALDESGKVPSSQLPSSNDVIEGYYYEDVFYSDSDHTEQITPEGGKIYIDIPNNICYRWTGSQYSPISNSDAYTKEEIDAMIGNTVHLSAQTLTNGQKTQVRDNIGLDNVINAAVTSEASQRAVADNSLRNSINSEISRAQLAEQQLQEQYNALTQSDIIVGSLPASGTKNKIYRVPGTNTYSDYMWNGSSFIEMATYDNAIDNMPISGSNNLVKSGGVYNATPSNKNSLYENSDLDVVDEVNNLLLQLKQGHIKTKRFDSRNITLDESGSLDFYIRDDKGRIILIVNNGNIKTKNFDSTGVTYRYRPYSEANIHFSVPVNVNILKNTVDSESVQDSYVGNYIDYGVLMLPESYTRGGTPTRLVIFFHGAGGTVTENDSQTEQATYAKYLVANGFAVMDMAGLPSALVDTWQDLPTQMVKYNNMGSPLAMECYIKGYQWVIQNYNIAQDGVLIGGGSMGGLSSTNFVMNSGIPILAHGIYCPVLDTYNQPFLHPWNGGPKYALGKLYELDKDGNNNYIYSDEKLKGYNPIINKMQTFNQDGVRITSEGYWDFTTKKLNDAVVTEYKDYPCPLKIWHCDDDPTVNITVSERQISSIRNAGGRAWLRRFPTGGHGPETAGTPVANPTGDTILKGVSVGTIYPSNEELYLFFKRFSNI